MKGNKLVFKRRDKPQHDLVSAQTSCGMNRELLHDVIITQFCIKVHCASRPYCSYCMVHVLYPLEFSEKISFVKYHTPMSALPRHAALNSIACMFQTIHAIAMLGDWFSVSRKGRTGGGGLVYTPKG